MAVARSSDEASMTRALQALGARMDPVIDLLDHLENVFFWIKDSKGAYRWINMVMIVERGLRSRAEMIGKTDFDYFEAELANQYRLDDEYVLAGNAIRGRIEEVVINHVSSWYSTTKFPLRDRRGRVVGTAGLATPIRKPSREAGHGSPLVLAIQHMGRHFREPVKNAVLARICGMSPGNFQRRFRASYHCTPHTYLRELRVRMSCQDLVHSERSLAAIADEHGFADQSHFTKEFRKFMAETPRAYRARYQRRT
jgi:AraC-like DNA-binding protein